MYLSQKKIHGDKYNYDNTIYNESNSPITVFCNNCNHDVEINKLTEHIGKPKRGCKKCSIKKRNKNRIIPLKYLIDNVFNKVHNKYYIYCLDEENHNGSRGNVKVKCLNCNNVFVQNVKSHNDGKGCPKCSSKGIDYSKPGILYYASINNGSYYKIGITTVSTKNRFRYETANVRIIKTWEYPIASEALKVEQEILKLYNKYRTKKRPLVDGNTEIFICDVLKLDSDFC